MYQEEIRLLIHIEKKRWESMQVQNGLGNARGAYIFYENWACCRRYLMALMNKWAAGPFRIFNLFQRKKREGALWRSRPRHSAHEWDRIQSQRLHTSTWTVLDWKYSLSGGRASMPSWTVVKRQAITTLIQVKLSQYDIFRVLDFFIFSGRFSFFLIKLFAGLGD